MIYKMNTPNAERIGVSKAEYFFSLYGWIFRDQPTGDYGVDAHVEIVSNDNATGSLIALQIKSGQSYFSKSRITNVHIGYPTNTRHVEYWLNYSLPVILILYHPIEDIFYWEIVSENTVKSTGKGWKVNIPIENKLTESTLEELCKISKQHKSSVKNYAQIPLQFSNNDSGKPIYQFPFNAKPQNLLVYDGYVISANWGSGSISIINPINKLLVRTIDLDNYEIESSEINNREIRQYPPGDLAVANGRIFVGQIFSEFILVIDIDTNAIVKRIYIPGGGEGKMAYAPT
jgi:hypothetical protein